MYQCPYCGRYFYSDKKCIFCDYSFTGLDEIQGTETKSINRKFFEVSDNNAKKQLTRENSKESSTNKDKDAIKKKNEELKEPKFTAGWISIIVCFAMAAIAAMKNTAGCWVLFVISFIICAGIINNYDNRKKEYEISKLGSEEAYNRVKAEKERIYKERQQEDLRRWKEEQSAKKYNGYQYKCPMCGSDRVINISMTKKGLGVATVGLASKTIGKNYQCAACKYMW